MNTGATFSECRRYRYELWRIWDNELPEVMFIGLNPSTADEMHDDPTIRRCISFSRHWGYGGLVVCNLFAYRATDCRDLMIAKEPIGRDNDEFLLKNAKRATLVIAAWGNNGRHLDRSASVVSLIPNLHCLKVNHSGEPSHPLYLSSDARPRLYCGRGH